MHNATTTQLETMQRDILDLVEAMRSSPVSPGNKRDQLRVLEGSPEEPSLVELGDYMWKFRFMAKSFSHENYILSRLVFSSIYKRGDVIEDAESGTFDWLVDEPEKKDVQPDEEVMFKAKAKEEAKEEAMRDKTREDFVAWLNSGRHIFHISGKAGSGKSTLMKFLGNSARVKEELHSWAGDQPLIFARFFFWNSGHELQMSLEGLYRSLLFEVCRQSPALIPRIFPDLWKSLLSGFAPPQQTPLQFGEVKIAFNRLIQESETMNSRICFFIDGLDEFQGDDVDHWRIAQDLQSWTQSENIKLCVSSRPHTPFLDTFSKSKNVQISIHDLTRRDIRHFCLAMFEKDPNFSRVEISYKDLVREIVWNANGVFLWAMLVVRALLRKIGHRSATEDLDKTLVSMPKDLDGLFDRILGSIHPDDQQLSDTLFLLTSVNFTFWQPTVQNAISYSWLEDLEDPDFPWNRPMSPCSVEEIKDRLHRVSCLLDRLSRGFLEVVPNPWKGASQDGHGYFGWNIQFFHRSAREYITHTRQVEMRRRAPSVDVHAGAIRLCLAQLQFARPTALDINPPKARSGTPINNFTVECLRVLSFARDAGYTIPPHFFEAFRRIFERHAHPGKSPEDEQGCRSRCYLRGEKLEVDSCGDFFPVPDSDRPAEYFSFVIPQLYDLHPPEMKVRRGDNDSQSGPNWLLEACTHGIYDLAASHSAVRELLSEGWSPKDTIRIEKPTCRKVHPHTGLGYYQGEPPRMLVSIWLVYLYQFASYEWRTAISNSRSTSDGTILEKLLRFGADRDVQFVICGFATSASEFAGERFTLTLIELLEIAKLSNIDTVRAMLRVTTPWWSRLGSGLVSGSSSSSLSSLFLRRYKAVVSTGDIDALWEFTREFKIESVVAPSERLDIPFRYTTR